MNQHSVIADGYAITELLGRGGSSSVYRAHQEAFDREVAVKVLEVDPRDDDVRRRFVRECSAAGRVSSHPNIVTILDSGVTRDGRPFLATELCPGGSLAERCRTGGPMSVAEVLRIGVKLSGAAATAHSAGILHRDVKPDNVLITAFGEPALTDFGISTVGEQAPSTTTRGSYTLHHAPPETLSGGQITAAADIYGLCSTLHHLLAGHPPFGAETGVPLAIIVNRVMHESPPPIARADVPPALQDILAKGMAKDPAQRFASAAALGEALQSVQRAMGEPVTEMVVLNAPSVEASPSPPSPPLPPSSPPPPPADATMARRPIVAAAGGLAAAGTAGDTAAGAAAATPPAGRAPLAPPPPPSFTAAAPSDSGSTIIGGVRALPNAGTDVAPPPATDGTDRKRRVVLLVAGAVALALVAGGAALYLSRDDSPSAATNAATSTTAQVSTTGASTTVASSTTTTSISTTTTVVETTTPTTLPATTVAVVVPPPVTTARPVSPQTTQVPTTAAPVLAVTSLSANPKTAPCGDTPTTEVTLTWKTTQAASVTIGIDNPGSFEQGLPPNGSFTLPYAGCSNGNNKVTYYVIAKGFNGVDAITKTIVVNASP